MDVRERFNLIKKNTAEIVTDEELLTLLKENDSPSVYLGTAITGKPHIGYFIWVLKLADFLKAGFKVKVLLADLHGALDKTPWGLLEKRYIYYNLVVPAMFEAIGVDTRNFEIVKGSSFQIEKKFFYDCLQISTLASVHDCTKAASEVVKMEKSPKLSGLIYPIMQSLDEEYLDVDVQCGGLDQRKILMFAREYLPKIGYKRRIEVMTPMIPGLTGKKMSASVIESKIDLLDPEQDVKRKMMNAFCPAGVVEDNGVLAFTKYLIMDVKEGKNEKFTIERPAKFGGNITYSDYGGLEKDFKEKKLHPQDLKNAAAKEINKLLGPIRKKFKGKERLAKEAYPEE